MPESWKPVPKYSEFYEVSDHGRVRSLSRTLRDGRSHEGKVLEPWVGDTGYLEVCLSVHGERHTFRVHRLVVRAFVGPIPDGKEVNHRDGNKLNNHVQNLEIVTVAENVEHARQNGLSDDPPRKIGTENGKAKLTPEKVRQIRALEGVIPYRVIGERFGVSKYTVCDVIQKRTWAHVD